MPSKKNKAAVEVIPADPKAKPTREQVVNAKHTVVYEAPEIVQVPVEEAEIPIADVEFEEQDAKPRQPSFRMKIRQRFEQRGIGLDETLTLRIDKLPLYEQNGLAGVKTEKEFCGVIQCTEKLFETDEYLTEIQRRYGPGEYWLTVRHKNAIVSNWRERVGGFPVQAAAVVTEPGQPPQIIYQQPMAGQAPPRNFKDELREFAEMLKLFDNIRGPREEGPAPVQSPDEVLAGAILKTPDMVENVVGGLVKRFGRNGNPDDDPTPWAVAMRAIETGQAAQIVNNLVNGFFNGLRGMIPQNGGQQHGQAQMGTPPFQNQAPIQNQNVQPPANLHEIQNPQTQPQSAPDMGEAGAPASPDQQQQMSPENQALSLIITQCQRKAPPRLVFSQLMDMEGRYTTLLDQHAMQTGQILPNPITANLGLFAYTPIESVMNFVRSLPNGANVADLPHAKEWTEQLQRLIKQDIEREEEPEKS